MKVLVAEDDRFTREGLVGFEIGADDFIVKPFSLREVVARVQAVARRCCARQPNVPTEFQLGDLKVIPVEL